MKKYLLALCTAVLVAVTGAVGCTTDEPVQITYLKLNRNELMLALGETFRLEALTRPADAGVPVKWTSSDESVATVAADGTVTGKNFGATVITARYRSYSARCAVRLVRELPGDYSAALAAPLSEALIYSKKVVLYAPRRIMQGFDIVPSGKIYYSQVGSDAYTLNVCRASGPSVDARTGYMIFKRFGHATQIVAEEASDGKTYIWLNSNASVGADGEYGDNWSFSRVEYTPGAVYEEGYAGDTFLLNKDGQYDQQVAIDFANRLLLVGSRKSGVRYFWVFNLDEALALPLKQMQVSVTIGGAGEDIPKQTVVRKFDARDLNDCRVVANFSVPAGADKEHDVYSYSHQGHEISGDYIYFYEGNAVAQSTSFNYNSIAYLTTFDYNGGIIVPRTAVAAIADAEGLAAQGLTAIGYAEAESLKIKDGKLYLGVACRDSSSDRWANILVYERAQQ